LDTAAIIEELEFQLSCVNSALSALQGTKRGPGRPAQSTDGRKRKGPLSAAARKKISDGMKKRWAAKKKAA
jgi:hypothetical protein